MRVDDVECPFAQDLCWFTNTLRSRLWCISKKKSYNWVFRLIANFLSLLTRCSLRLLSRGSLKHDARYDYRHLVRSNMMLATIIMWFAQTRFSLNCVVGFDIIVKLNDKLIKPGRFELCTNPVHRDRQNFGARMDITRNFSAKIFSIVFARQS